MSAMLRNVFGEPLTWSRPSMSSVSVRSSSSWWAATAISRSLTRMAEVGLRLHPDKTRIVYRKDSTVGASTSTPSLPSPGTASGHGRRGARPARSSRRSCPRSVPRRSRPNSDRLRELRIHTHTNLSPDDLARWPNPQHRWVNELITTAVTTGRRYTPCSAPASTRRVGLGGSTSGCGPRSGSNRGVDRLPDRAPGLFAHWRWVRLC